MLSRLRFRTLAPVAVIAVVLAASVLLLPSHISSIFVSCSTGTFSATPNSLPAAGPTVVETASATCSGAYGGSTPMFRFWERDPGAGWANVQDYSTTNTHNFNTTGKANGVYNLEVDVRSQDENTSGTPSYDFVLFAQVVIGACTNAGLAVNPASGTGHTGGSVLMTGSSSNCASPVYRFWVQDPGRAWSIVQDYSATTTHTWGPAGTYHVGTYNMEVDVRSAGATNSYDSVANISYSLVGCTGATIAGVPASPQANGAGDIVLTATATCPGTPNYRFWIFDPNGSHWSMVQDYSAANTYTWKAGNQRRGVSKIEVDVRDAGSLDSYEFATSGQTYTTTGCTAASITPSPASPQVTGAGNVTLTASATCPGTATYQFWIMDPGSHWSMVRDYSTTNTYTWAAANQRKGISNIQVYVRDQGSQESYEFASTPANYTFS